MPRKPAPAPSKPRRRVLERADGRTVEPVTIYPSPELVRRVRHWCVDRDLSMSDAFVLAVEKLLSE